MINLSTLMPLLIAGLITQDALAHGSPDHYKFDAKSGYSESRHHGNSGYGGSGSSVVPGVFTFLTGGSSISNTYGSTLSLTNSGIGVNASAWSTTGPGNTLQTAQLEIYTGYGMGVCDRAEGINCSAPNHTLDNVGAKDLILFQFSDPVVLNTLTLMQFNNSGYNTADSDISFWAGNGPISLAGNGLAILGTAHDNNWDGSSANGLIRTVDMGSVLSGSYSWLAVAASVSDSTPGDRIKIRGLTVTSAPITPVPEGDTWVYLLSGLSFVAWRARRRHHS